jgi:hypothetical protein
MQPSKCFKSEGLEGDRRLLTRQQDSIASLLVLGSARGGPTRHEVHQVGNGEWGRANDVDRTVTKDFVANPSYFLLGQEGNTKDLRRFAKHLRKRYESMKKGVRSATDLRNVLRKICDGFTKGIGDSSDILGNYDGFTKT